jgi:hypothetical protein
MDVLERSKALNNQQVMDLYDGLLHRVKNMALSTGGLAIGSSSKAKVKIASTVNYLSDGVFKTKTTAEVAFTATTHDIAANAASVQEACYLLTLAANGDPTLTMGAIATGSGNALLPEIPATGTPIGYVRIAIAAGSTKFDASTDELDAAHITDTYVDLGFVAPKFGAAQ